MKNILITGGAGFIGSHFCDLVMAETDWKVVCLDKLTYAGSLENLKDCLDDSRFTFVEGAVEDPSILEELFKTHRFDHVAHLAAESHVDRSITGPEAFIRSNIVGTYCMLEAFRAHHASHPEARYLQVSTDEVYGSIAGDDVATETWPLLPNSPYSASKASGDLLVRAYVETYGLPLVTTRTSNNFGPRQFWEKLIPTVIRCALEDRPIPVYGDGLNVRDWIYVADHCRGLLASLQRGKPGGIYNMGGTQDLTNLDLVHRFLDVLGKPRSLISFVTDRPGHDQRYAISSDLAIQELGFEREVGFEEGVRRSVEWYRARHSEGWRLENA